MAKVMLLYGEVDDIVKAMGNIMMSDNNNNEPTDPKPKVLITDDNVVEAEDPDTIEVIPIPQSWKTEYPKEDKKTEATINSFCGVCNEYFKPTDNVAVLKVTDVDADSEGDNQYTEYVHVGCVPETIDKTQYKKVSCERTITGQQLKDEIENVRTGRTKWHSESDKREKIFNVIESFGHSASLNEIFQNQTVYSNKSLLSAFLSYWVKKGKIIRSKIKKTHKYQMAK